MQTLTRLFEKKIWFEVRIIGEYRSLRTANSNENVFRNSDPSERD